MTVIIVFVLLCVAAVLIFAGAAEIERRAKNWERYEQWMHPPDDDDGIMILEDDDDEDG